MSKTSIVHTKTKRLDAIGRIRNSALSSDSPDYASHALGRISSILSYEGKDNFDGIAANTIYSLWTTRAMEIDFHEAVEIENITSAFDLSKYLEARFAYKVLPQLKLLQKYPPCVQIEISSICNYRCKMCFQVDKTFSSANSPHMGYMNMDLFKKIVRELSGNVESVTLASRGEPLMSPTFCQMLAHIKDKFQCLKINTNLSLLDEDKAIALLNANPQTIVFSLDSGDPDLYKEIRVNGRLSQIKKKLELFQTIYDKLNSKCIIRISGVAVDDRQSTLELYSDFAKYADLFSLSECTPWNDSYNNQVNTIIKPCNDLWRRMFIWWDGTANPCDYDYKSNLSVGNINIATIADIWQSNAYNKLRKDHLNSQRQCHMPCDRCPIT